MKRVAIIGHSEGNGHPFSYSSIVNGYSNRCLADSGWPGIYEYVRRRHRSEFGIEGIRITHAWTQDRAVTEKLCAACMIPNAVAEYQALIGEVDAVIIARDDFETHYQLSMPFLKAGVPVFVDKPLGLKLGELRDLKPFLEEGLLMSCSGMRFARELDEPRADLISYGNLKLIRCAIVLSWEKYGVHLLEAALSVTPARPVSVLMLPAEHSSVAVRLDDGVLLQIDAMGDCARTFHIEIFGTQRIGTFDITDNFSMFRRMLWEFAESIRTGKPAIEPDRTLDIMRVLIAGNMSRTESREVFLHEIEI